MRRLTAWVGVLLVVPAACAGTGLPAPNVLGTEVACGDEFCVTYPDDWVLDDSSGTFLSFHHPGDPDAIVASAGRVNMEGLVTANGGTWPQTVRGVVETFWGAIDGGNAELATVRTLDDGSVRSFGVFRGGRMWYRLVPVDGVRAVGVEVRGPNSGWEPHADAFLEGLVVIAAPGAD